MAEPENPVLDHLRSIRAEMAKLANWMSTLAAEMSAIRQHLGGVMALQEHDHTDMASIKVRLDRIERGLDLVD